MPRRIEIELTSHMAEGSWTWRAAGARQPKGVVESVVLPEGAAVGDVLRAEIESSMEGIDVVRVLPAKEREEKPVTRIEVMGRPPAESTVSVELARRRSKGNGSGRARQAGERGERSRGRPGPRDGQRARSGPRERVEKNGRRERPSRTDGRDRGAARKRPDVSTEHRNAMLERLRPEQLAVAEQLLRGGLPAVREAISEQNDKAKAAGSSPVASEGLMAMAEELLPTVNLASWKDRATSAQRAGKEGRLRELRAVVTASRTLTLDEEGRDLGRTLQEQLERRLTVLRDSWTTEMTGALETGKIAEALRSASRPPDPTTRLSAELASRLSDTAGRAMTDSTPTAEWLELLEAVAESPVRRTVHPEGIPEAEEAKAAARRAAGLVPGLAKLLGLRVPPPPPRRLAGRPRVRAGAGAAPGAGPSSRRPPEAAS